MKKLLTCIALGSLLLASCSTTKRAEAYSSAPRYSNEKVAENASQPSGQTRLVNFDATVRLDTKTPDTAMVQLGGIAKKYGGYVQAMNGDECTIRVKSDYFMTALSDVGMLGKVIDKNIRSTDVTDQYNDLTVRLENAEKTRQRYMELLQKAHTIDEVLRVEREIDRITLDIEQLKGKLAVLNDEVSFSSITVNIHEKTKPGAVSYVFIGLYKGVKWLFVRG